MRMPKKKFFGFYSSTKHGCDTTMEMQVGYHLIVELKTKLELSNDALIRALMKRIVEECELTEVSNFFHKFGGEGGVAGVVLLEESHLSIHTWPEFNYAAVDLFLCGEPNADALCKQILEIFKATSHTVKILPRGL